MNDFSSQGSQSTEPLINPKEIKEQLVYGQIAILQSNFIPNLVASFMCATVVFLGVLPTSSIYITWWYGSVILLTSLRLCLTVLYKKVSGHPKLHLNLFIIGSTMASLLWGMVGSILMPHDLIAQMVVIVIVAGVSAGGLQTLNANLVASLLFLVGCVAPLDIWLMMQNGNHYNLLSVAMTLYLIFMIVACYRNNRLFSNSQNLYFENINLLEALRQQTIQDPLTGLYNRRYLTEVLPRELKRSFREKTPLCIAILDLDHFKQINDTYGHSAGDVVLKRVSHVLKNAFRESDLVFRLGGEEFLIILINTSLDNAIAKLNKTRDEVKKINILFKGTTLRPISASIGVTSSVDDTKSSLELLRAADQALYAAKNSGRDAVRAWENY